MKKTLASLCLAASGMLGIFNYSNMCFSKENALDLYPTIENFAEKSTNNKTLDIELTAGSYLSSADMFVMDKIYMDSSKEEKLRMLAEMDPDYTSIWDLNLDLKTKMKIFPAGSEVIIGAVGKKVITSRYQQGAKSSLCPESDVNLGIEFKPFKKVPLLEGVALGFEGKGMASTLEKRVGLEWKLFKILKLAGAVYTKGNKTIYTAGASVKYFIFKLSATYKAKENKGDAGLKAEIKFRW